MKTLKSDIFYAMNEINDKYILEAAQCLEQKKENDISLQKNSKLFHESNAHSRKWLARVATAMAVSIILFTTGGIANAATGEKLVQWINGLFGAELVTDENEGLIGKEVIDNSEPEVTHGEESDIGNAEGRAITESHIIKSVADDNIVLPLSVSEFKVENDTTPEIIMTNGSMAVFYLEDYAGWNCKAGDILTFSFEKYESDAVSNQALVIGYIKDGVMYDGESFGSLSGSYELKVREGGEYNLYIISATSDYLTLKQGTINLSKWNNYKSGVIRKDAWNTINDVTISDYNEVSSTAGVTSSAGTIKFNTYQMDNFTSAQKRNVCTHELGHALGLAHNAKGDVMYAYVSSVTSLSANDKASYDASYKRY